MTHDARVIGLDVYNFSLASTGGPSARTIVLYGQSGPHLPGRSPSQHPQKGTMSGSPSRPPPKRTDWAARNVALAVTLKSKDGSNVVPWQRDVE